VRGKGDGTLWAVVVVLVLVEERCGIRMWWEAGCERRWEKMKESVVFHCCAWILQYSRSPSMAVGSPFFLFLGSLGSLGTHTLGLEDSQLSGFCHYSSYTVHVICLRLRFVALNVHHRQVQAVLARFDDLFLLEENNKQVHVHMWSF
jgi:hypothetical protein